LFERNWNEKNENSEKCFGFLSKWCKTKKSGGVKCKTIEILVNTIKILGGAPAPSQLCVAPPLISLLF
jgi:hypothetical protein